MTWVIKVIYQPDDGSKQAVGVQQLLTDGAIKNGIFDVRVEAFKSMLNEIDEELRNAKNT